ncbi:glycosyltransferase family 2 protein [Sulfurimonas microaerophilic]|uniref:glycosyltransferase family 2 protein n=1 Tax=Sulfurimonas microaerophilic TaxID=3058392 RepID=UPI002714BBC1|nr:glycosyltransferase family 2 protein [Sulfurimonas sp. hsl 1-7]
MNIQVSVVSIALCTYNGEKFISQQLDSILKQTYSHLEIIIVDDGSTDKTVEILQNYKNIDTRIKFFQNEKNLGYVKNFEKAISLCKGDYIALADQDDIWNTRKIETFLSRIKSNVLIYSDAELIDDNSKNLHKNLIQPDKQLVKGHSPLSFLFDNCISGNTMMFKKELVKHILPIPDIVSFHDVWIAYVASSLSTIIYTKECFTFYRRYSTQVTADIEQKYSSFSDKLQVKKSRFLNDAKKSIEQFSEYKKVAFNNTKLIILLDLLIEHNQNYQKGFFNFTLYKFLLQHQDEIFKIKNKKHYKSQARKVAAKFKLHQLLFYSM